MYYRQEIIDLIEEEKRRDVPLEQAVINITARLGVRKSDVEEIIDESIILHLSEHLKRGKTKDRRRRDWEDLKEVS